MKRSLTKLPWLGTLLVIFLFSSKVWSQPYTEIQKIQASNGASNDNHGFASDIHGDYAVVGSPFKNAERGEVYIYYKDQGGPDNWGQIHQLTAFDQAIGDRYGFNVSIFGTYVAVGSLWDDDHGQYSGSVYLYEKDQGGANNWGLVKKITPSDAGAYKGFGIQVSLSATELIVGANESFFPNGGVFNPIGPGAAYIFNINQGGANNWGQVKKITASDGSTGNQFAFVDIDGDIAVVGAWNKNSLNGGAYIYSRNSGGANNWGQVKILGPSVGGLAGYGTSVGVSGSNVVVGSYYENSSKGAAYVYGQNQGGGNNWGLVKKITAPTTVSNGEWFGTGVSIHNNRILVGAHGNPSTFTNGEAYIFEQNQGGTNNWGQTQMLTASDASSYDSFGSSVSIRGSHLVVGASGNDDNGSSSGSAYIFSNCSASTPSSISASTNPLCSGNSTTLSVVGGNTGSGGSFVWYTGSCGGTSAGTGASITVSPSSTTTYYVRAEAPCGNSSCTSITITVNQPSSAPSSISSNINCNNGTASLTVTGGSLGTGASWQWYSGSCGGTPVGSGTSITVSPTSSTTYYVRAEGICGNTSCSSITLPGLPSSAPSAAWSNPSSGGNYCETSGSINLNSLITGTSGGTWSGTGVSGSTFNPNGVTGSVTITYSVGTAPCNDSQSHTFNVQPDVDAVWSAPSGPICEAAGSISLNTYLGGASTGGSWSGSGVSGSTFNPSGLSGAIGITYTVGTGVCAESSNQSITVNPDVDPNWSNPSPVCVSTGTIDLSTLITGTSGGSFSGTGVTGNIFDPSGLAGQSVSITYTVGTAPCEEQQSYSIMVTSAVNAAWNAPTDICESATTLDLSTLITGNTGGTWSGPGVSGSSFNPMGQSGSVSITYSVGISACTDTQSSNITVLAAPSVPSVGSVSDTICEGDTTSLIASGSGSGVTYNIYDAAMGGNLLGTTPLVVNPLSTTTYYIEAINANNCTQAGGRVPVSVTVISVPVADAGGDQTICPGQVVNLMASGGSNYAWDHGDMTSGSNVSPTISTYYYVNVSNWQCIDRDSVLITVVTSTPGLAVDDASTTTANTAITFDVSSNDSGDPNTVSIVNGPMNGSASNLGGDITYEPHPGFVGTDTVQYSICNPNCSNVCDTAYFIIVVNSSDISIPNGITPNGDGINETLVISGIEHTLDNELIIFNRWGDQVFASSPYKNDWSGQSQNATYGDQVVDGTYFYVFTYTNLLNETKKLNGYIEVKSR